MSVRPLATPDTSFSDAIVCRFRLRPLEIEDDSKSFTFGPEESELGFAFSFDAAQPGADGTRPVQDGYVIAPSGETARLRVDEEEGARLDGLRVYAGLCSDPFFLDLAAYLESITTGRLAFRTPGQNFATNFNALGIVLEVDCAALLRASRGPIFGVVGETVVAGKIPIRLERVGAPRSRM